jgi:hypothetical protein
MIREISREEAETLLTEAEITSTKVNQKDNKVDVTLRLADDHTCLVRFDRHNGEKHYFVQQSKSE